MRVSFGNKPANADLMIQPIFKLTCCTYSEEEGELTKEVTVSGHIFSVPQVPADQVSSTNWTLDIPVPYGMMWKYYNVSYITSATVAIQFQTDIVSYSVDPILAR